MYKLNPNLSGDHITLVKGEPVNLGGRDLNQTVTVNGVETTKVVRAATQEDFAILFEQRPKLANGQFLIIKVENRTAATSKK